WAMIGLARIARRIRALLRRDALDAEVDEEMRHHLAMEAADIARLSGVPPDEARRRALVGFGGVSRFQEEHRDARGVQWLEQALRDLRHAARGLRRSPGFALSAVLVLALGIGSTTAVFSAVNAVLRDPTHEGLAVILFRGFPSLSTVDYRAIEQQQRSFAAVGGLRLGEAAYRAGGEAEHVRVGRVTSGFFAALGLRAASGRLIQPRDEPVGVAPVAVLAHGFAVRTLGSPSAAVGQTVRLDGIAHTVVGVLPPASEMVATAADVWTALQLPQPQRRGPFGMMVIARLRPGVTYESATRDVSAISDRILPLWAPGFSDRTARFEAVPIRAAFLASSSRMLRIFGAGVGLVLLIGIANVASLMLVRAIGRSHEVSLRATLGASRAQLVRLFATESALLSAAGAVAGLAVGALALRALIALGPRLPGLTTAALDARAAAFAVALALAAGLVVGAYPVVMLLRTTQLGLASGDRAIGGRRAGAVRSVFVVAQFALALPLLAIAGLLLISFLRLQRVDPGFDPRNMVTVQVSLPAGQYGDDAAIAAYWARALPRVRDVPGVRVAGLGTSMPPDDFGNSNDNFNLIDRPVAPGAPEPNAPWPRANSEYFATLGVRLLDGRLFTPTDTGARPVIVVSRSWVRKYYPDVSPLGKTLVRGGCTDCPPTTIVGVVDDVRYSGLAGPLDAMYSPLTEGWDRTAFLYVRTAGSPGQFFAPIRDALRSVDPSVPLADVASMEDRLYRSMAQPRDWATLLGAFAAAALGLAAIGIFGMLSYMVTTRRREIGVRMALGASRRTVVQMIMRSGLTHAIAGSALGLVAALVSARALTTVLYDVSATDPAALAAVTAVLLAVALVACWLPARRAATIDPLEAIRHE
ncbi:MAG: ADOP family duplicated permease, partial [Gemmatimonadaceae bacterium]